MKNYAACADCQCRNRKSIEAGIRAGLALELEVKLRYDR